MSSVANHYGYGLRNDEKPFAHKIPPGGNWKSLDRADQIAFMGGAINSGGGQTMFLRRMTWDAPALTVTVSPMGKATCQLHPGQLTERSDVMTQYYDVTPQLPSNGFTVVDLFCGGGLGAVGIQAAGFNIIAAYDFDKRAVQAYRHNFGDHVQQADLSAIDPADIPDADVIFGGPPCQDFSIAGKNEGDKGKNGQLVWAYLDIITAKQPKAFVFENVKNLVGKRHKQTFDALVAKFNEIGYAVTHKVINSWDYGVAQKRESACLLWE